MQYINGNEISNQSILQVMELALSIKINWQYLEKESDADSKVYGFSSEEKGIYLNKGVCKFNISPESMYQVLYDIKKRKEWDNTCISSNILEEYDHLNDIIHLTMSHHLGLIDMNLYRSCKFDLNAKLFIIAMRSIELDDGDESCSFECMPNGWVVQGIDGEPNQCILTFVQQCHIRDIEVQTIPGYRSFRKQKEAIKDFHYLTIFPSSVSGHLTKIFDCLKNYLCTSNPKTEIGDPRIHIIKQAEREVNELFGTSNPEYGWKSCIKKTDMEVLLKRNTTGFIMIGKGCFSSMYSPDEIFQVLDTEIPFQWDTFFESATVVEKVDENTIEANVVYRMWKDTFQMRALQSVKKGPGNYSSLHFRSISTMNNNDQSNVFKGFNVCFLPSAVINYGLGSGSFTNFIISVEVKGGLYSDELEEQLLIKTFGARLISCQNSIIKQVGEKTKRYWDNDLVIIPRMKEISCYDPQMIQVEGVPSEFADIIDSFSSIILSDDVVQVSLKRKRNEKEKRMQRPSIRITSNMISNLSDSTNLWNQTKKQPFLFLINEDGSGKKEKIRKKVYNISNSSFDTLPEEIIYVIFSNLSASSIVDLSLVCKRFKLTTDSQAIWKHLYLKDPTFQKRVPRSHYLKNSNNPMDIILYFTNGVIPNISPQELASLPPFEIDNFKLVLPSLPLSVRSCVDIEQMDKKIKELGPILPADKDSIKERFINWKELYTNEVKLYERWSQMRPKRVSRLLKHTKSIITLKCEGNSAISVSKEKSIGFWNLNSGQCVASYNNPNTSVVSIAYDRSKKSNYIWPLSDYTKVFIGHKNGLISIIDFFEQPIKVESNYRPVLLADGFDFSHHGKYVIWENNQLDLWDAEGKARLWTKNNHTKKIQQAKVLCPNGPNSVVGTVSSDKTVKLWDLTNGDIVCDYVGHTAAVNCIESLGQYLILTGSSDKTLRLWDQRKPNTPLCTYQSSHTSPIRCIAYQEKTGIALSGSDDGSIVSWSLDGWSNLPNNSSSIGTFKETGKLSNHHESSITSIDSDEAGFISGSSNGTIIRWDFTN
ncbi:hypothetical protein CYY_009798 [Polysphondylium violaceum]|uniref:WD40 repeat-containing protein n=1 Tax=Polysphondylium violaceum TaxID=133409 RepID=A0A8J4V080_9MYCE|nr:hypothetical protein CYY_009798 [Polysphondylium violaceum]